MCLCVHTSMCRCPQKPERGIRSPGARVTDGCELPDGGAKNQIQVLCESNKCSLPLDISLIWGEKTDSNV